MSKIAKAASAADCTALAELKQRGIKDADKAPIPAELFQAQAEKRVRVAEALLVRSVAAGTLTGNAP